MKLDAATWNAHYPVGTTVLFELVRNRPDTREIRKTRTEAYDTQNGTMVMLEGRAGGCACDFMIAIQIPERKCPECKTKDGVHKMDCSVGRSGR